MFEISQLDANKNENIIPTATAITGIAVDNIPVPIPDIITVAGPVFVDSAIFCVGR